MNLSSSNPQKAPARKPGPFAVCVCKGEGEMGDTLFLGTKVSYRKNMAILCPENELFMNLSSSFYTKSPGLTAGAFCCVCCKGEGEMGDIL
jgi:hypothetical protein